MQGAHARRCKTRPEKMQNAPSIQNTPGKMRNKHAGSRHARPCKTRPEKCKTHRRCKTRPEKCVKSMLVQNTPPVQKTPGKNAKHTVGAKHARKNA
jgi:hypothetical protein